ncbi:MAG TPA: molybdate ABC transporter substrate-binding protein, partial [Pyrinomonadaceae bacterium]
MKTMPASAARLRLLTSVLTALLLSFAPSCSTRDERRAGEDEGEIVIAAAANLSAAFDALSNKFTERTGARVRLSYGATADLARQIENGAPFDVFASADVRHVEELERKGLVEAGTLSLYARGRLVLWMPQASAARLARIEDLADARITKIAIAKPDIAPYGRAAVEALRAKGVWETVEPKVVYSQNVAQAAQFAASGNADAAFVPRSLLKAGEGSSVEVEGRLHSPIE